MTAADLPPGRPRSPFLTGLAVGALLVAFSIAAFQLLRSEDGGDAATTTTTATTAPDSTSGPADTTTTTDGTAPDSTTTTTAAVTPPDPYTAVGDPIAIEELQLTTNGIGPITFGTAAAEAAGRLISSLGEPDADSGPVVSTGAYGTCPGVTERIVRWGPLAAIMQVDESGGGAFAGYRLDLSYGGLSSPATELATFSGLQASDTVAELNEIYRGLQIDFLVETPLGEIFELRGEDGALLLWGPVTSSQDDGIVLGIYAPDACAG
jgi:hypothetical protein